MFFCGQVVNHGLGGEYGAHRDTHGPTRTPPQPEVGERLATVLTHLQAPAQGRCRAGESSAPRLLDRVYFKDNHSFNPFMDLPLIVKMKFLCIHIDDLSDT